MHTRSGFEQVRLLTLPYVLCAVLSSTLVIMCGGYNPSDLNQIPMNSCSYVNFHGRLVSDFWVEPQVSHASLVRLQVEGI